VLLERGLGEHPAGNDAPAWLRAIVERALSIDPGARYPSMTAMLDELTRDPHVRRRQIAIAAAGGAVIAAAVGVTLAVSSPAGDRPEPCTGAEGKLAGVWDDARREAMRRAFTGVASYGAAAFEGTAVRLDDYRRAWLAMHVEACQATRLRGEQPESVMALRIACLDRRLRELGQLVDVFVGADAAVVERSLLATTAMSPLDGCADVARLLAVAAPPSDPAIAASVRRVTDDLGRAKALSDAGKYAAAAELATAAVALARETRYQPIEAEALVRLGEIQSYFGDKEAAAASLRAAVRAADISKDDVVRANALAWLVGVVGYNLERPAEALAYAEDARAVLARIDGDPRTEALLESSLGRTYGTAAKYDEMLEHHRKALALRRWLFGEQDPWTANSVQNVGAALRQGRPQRPGARGVPGGRLAIREKILGGDHPAVAQSLVGIGNQLIRARPARPGAVPRWTGGSRSCGRSHPAPERGDAQRALQPRRAASRSSGRLDESRAAFDECCRSYARPARPGGSCACSPNLAALLELPRGRHARGPGGRRRKPSRSPPSSTRQERTTNRDGPPRARRTSSPRRASATRRSRPTARRSRSTRACSGPIRRRASIRSSGSRGSSSRADDRAAAQRAAEHALAVVERRGIGGKWQARDPLRARASRSRRPPAGALQELARQALEWYATTAAPRTRTDRGAPPLTRQSSIRR
jgi:tetratricopeptide (TPR) repeat protein